MNAKKLLVSFLAVMSMLLFVVTVSAATELVTVNSVKVDGISMTSGSTDISVIAGETIAIEVFFESLEDASDVRIEAQLKGSKIDAEIENFVGDLENGKRYREVLSLRVPYELKDEVSDNLLLNIEIFNGDFKTELDDNFGEITLRVQRPAYNAAVMLIQTKNTINSGEFMAIDVVLKNIGYNDLDDTYVTVGIPALGLEKTSFFGDIIAVECDDDFSNLANFGVDFERKCNEDNDDTIRGRIHLEVPFDAETGIYTIEVEAKNDDLNVIQTKQIFIENEVPQTVIKSGNDLIILNPTNVVKVYTVIADSRATVSNSVVVVPAGSSRTVTVETQTSETFSVNVLSGDKIIGTVEFSGIQNDSTPDSIVVLIVVLAIIFLVLIIVLLVLLTRKPEKEEEFSESYY